MNPEIGRRAAEEQREDIKKHLMELQWYLLLAD